MVNDEVGLAERVDLVGITAELLHSSTHGSQVDDGWDASKVLEENTSWLEGNLEVLLGGDLPVQDSLDVSSYTEREKTRSG